MNWHQTWYTNKLLGGVLAKFNKCNGPYKRYKWVPSAYFLGLKINNIMSGEQAEVKKRRRKKLF